MLNFWEFVGALAVHKIISKFGYDPKESHDYTFVKRRVTKMINGSIYCQRVGPNKSHLHKQINIILFQQQRVHTSISEVFLQF